MYEITLHGAPPAGLTVRFPSLTLYSVPAVTVLSRRVVDLAEIDGLTEQLRAIGIAPVEMRASRKGKYLSLTCTITATSRTQLDDLYRDLTSHPMVTMVL